MKISPTMNLGELAARMGQITTEDEARVMRDILVDLHDGEDTADIEEHDWISLLKMASQIEIEANESPELLALSIDTCPNEEPYRSECARAWWDAFNSAAGADDRLSRVEFVRPRGNRSMLAQWNGARFAWSRAVFGSSVVPTQDQQDAIDEASATADAASAKVWRDILAELAATVDEVDE